MKFFLTTLAFLAVSPALAGNSYLVDCQYVGTPRGTITQTSAGQTISKGRIACTKCGGENGPKTVYTYNPKVLKTSGEGGCHSCGGGSYKK